MKPYTHMDVKTAASISPGQVINEQVNIKPAVDETTRRWQLSGIDVVEEIAHRFKGDNYDFTKNKWVTHEEMRLMADQGITEICGILSTFINKNLLLSNFNAAEIRLMFIDFEKSMTLQIEMNWERWGLERNDFDVVWLTICNTAWASLNRALNAGEKRFIESTEQRRIISSEGNQSGSDNPLKKIPVIGRLA
jgi:hypothetical protein